MVGMIANVVNTFDVDFIMPVSAIDENMKRAHNRDALLETKFWFKIPRATEADQIRLNELKQTNFVKSNTSKDRAAETEEEEKERIKELYIWQILEGDASVGMPIGLIQMFEEFMKVKGWSAEKIEETMKFIRFLAMRSRG